MSFQKYEAFKGELSKADHRAYIAQVNWLKNYCFAEWWNAIKSPNKILTSKEINLMYDNLTVASITLWLEVREYLNIVREERNNFTEDILKLPEFSGNTTKIKEIKETIIQLVRYVKRMVPLSESIDGAGGLPE